MRFDGSKQSNPGPTFHSVWESLDWSTNGVSNSSEEYLQDVNINTVMQVYITDEHQIERNKFTEFHYWLKFIYFEMIRNIYPSER